MFVLEFRRRGSHKSRPHITDVGFYGISPVNLWQSRIPLISIIKLPASASTSTTAPSPIRPRCPCSVPRSSIWAASSTCALCVTTPSARSLSRTRLKGAQTLPPNQQRHLRVPSQRHHNPRERQCLVRELLEGTQLLTESFCRQALRYIIRNTTLPPRVRAEAQLQLTQMHAYTRPTQIRNRCIMGGQGRGVLSDFKMTRVRESMMVDGKAGANRYSTTSE